MPAILYANSECSIKRSAGQTRADHAPRVDKQPQKRPVVGIDPRQRQVLDVGDPAVRAALERGAHAAVELEVGLRECRR